MSECNKENVTPQAETTIQGVVKDPRTGEPLPNIKLLIDKSWGNIKFGGGGYKQYDSLYTQPDGSYYLKFIPLGTGEYTLSLDVDFYKYFIYNNGSSIKIGTINTYNYNLQKAIILTVHLKNISAQNRTHFRLTVDSCCVGYNYGINKLYGVDNFTPIMKDTVMKYRVPYLSSVKVVSFYHKGNQNQPLTPADTMSIRKLFAVGKNDTTINVINP